MTITAHHDGPNTRKITVTIRRTTWSVAMTRPPRGEFKREVDHLRRMVEEASDFSHRAVCAKELVRYVGMSIERGDINPRRWHHRAYFRALAVYVVTCFGFDDNNRQMQMEMAGKVLRTWHEKAA